MKSLPIYLLSGMLLFLAHTDAAACSLNPTAVMSSPDADGVYYLDTPVLLDATESVANCGSIDEYRWRVRQNRFQSWVTVSTSSLDYHNFDIESSWTVELRVRNTAGNYQTITHTITITEEPERFYYLTDHLGSVRVTVNEKGDPVAWDDYYPFGLQMPGRTQNASNPNDDQKFTGYELEQQGDLNIYHAGARMYDPVIGRFNSVDPLASMYTSTSPYAYVLNNPLNAIDPDGRAVIFVNGFPFDGSTKERYWGSFASDIMSYFPGESAHFFDGGKIVRHSGRTESVSMWSQSGRYSSVFSSNLYSGSGKFETRSRAGYLDGRSRAAGIINSLSRNEKGVIDETIKIVTHSMGAGYSRGLISALQEYADENDIGGLNFEFILDIAAYQGSKIEDNGISGFQVGSFFDFVAGNKSIDGSTRIDGTS